MAAKVQIAKTSVDLLQEARQAEADGDLAQAAELYEALIKTEGLDEYPYDRLMILYRKLKQYKDELRVIDKGIRLYQKHLNKPTRNSARSRKLQTLSDAFLKSSGLKDKKGNLLYTPEPIARWSKRREVVAKKLK